MEAVRTPTAPTSIRAVIEVALEVHPVAAGWIGAPHLDKGREGPASAQPVRRGKPRKMNVPRRVADFVTQMTVPARKPTANITLTKRRWISSDRATEALRPSRVLAIGFISLESRSAA